MRDDGYDIADYKNINPAYGTMRDFRQFVREAHRRGLKVITELVINHTSDQHQRKPIGNTRRHPATTGLAERDFRKSHVSRGSQSVARGRLPVLWRRR